MIDDFKLYFFFFNFQNDNLAARSWMSCSFRSVCYYFTSHLETIVVVRPKQRHNRGIWIILACPNRDSIIAKKNMQSVTEEFSKTSFASSFICFRLKLYVCSGHQSFMSLRERRDTDRTVSLHFNARTHLKCLFICVKRAVYPVKEKWQNARKLISLLMPKRIAPLQCKYKNSLKLIFSTWKYTLWTESY